MSFRCCHFSARYRSAYRLYLLHADSYEAELERAHGLSGVGQAGEEESDKEEWRYQESAFGDILHIATHI
jgi:hypothetical protein